MKRFHFLLVLLFSCHALFTGAQQIKFNKIIKGTTLYSPIQSVAQDKQGFIWTVGYIGGATQAALYRYDGSDFKIYKSDAQKPNTIQNSPPLCMYIDDDNKIWIGHYGGGVDRFDPATGIFTNYRHNKKDESSLSNDTVNAITGDRKGNLWIGTQHGLNIMDKPTGRFTHYFHQANNPKSISNNTIGILYVDRLDELWIGCGIGSLPLYTDRLEAGGLNLFHQDTHTFTAYLHDPSDPNTITNNKISCIYEDSKGNFWVGTQGNRLHTLDRKTGKFTYYAYDPAHPKKLGSFPVDKRFIIEHISFINEDIKGGLWIGLSLGGLYRYDPITKETTHFGSVYQNDQIVYKDTLSGVKQYLFPHGITSKDGLFWVTGWPPAAMYNINFNKTAIPFVSLNANVNGNAFYQESGGNVLWVGTNAGLIRKDLINKTEKIWSKATPNGSGWAHDTIGNITRDNKGIFWIATLGGGLCRYDPVANKAFYYMHDKNNPGSIGSNMARNLLIDHNGNIWVGTWGQGLDMLDVKSQRFTHYVNSKDSTSLNNNTADYIYEGKDNNIWVGTFGGLNRLNKDGKTFSHYLTKSAIINIYADSEGVLWIGGYGGLDYYDKVHDKFLPFIDPSTEERLATVVDILEDDRKDLWIRTTTDIIEINRKNKTSKFFGEAWGVNINNVWISRSLKGKNDELFIGTLDGYYDFFPSDIKDAAPPQINITGFELDSTVNNDKSKLFFSYNTKEIELAHNQNSFVFDFIALHYASPGQEKYIVKLENYDRAWRDLGIEHRLPLFEIPPGKYTLRIKAFNADGAWAEKDIDIIINPPWWKTWWAYTLFGVAIFGAIWGYIQYRSRQLISENKLLEQKVNRRTEELQQSLEELKATQKQLVQSEKMASLGELTAGIAHEIQNPLNFVNNFCEVNTELLDEMQEEIEKGDFEEVKAIAADIKENQLKIHHHGKRADAIVKGMLQHSHSSTGQKEPVDINALADEYLRLSYHGLRAKDKSFNADLKTDFAPSLPKINLIPQDMGRVLLNLFNNAFYAVSEKKKNTGGDYEPLVSVSTAKIGNQLEIRVRDNGNGVPQNVIDKVFQPFFTTKPTGEGTGLGLSITFDIINQVHGGTIAIETEEGKYAEFIIRLPY